MDPLRRRDGCEIIVRSDLLMMEILTIGSRRLCRDGWMSTVMLTIDGDDSFYVVDRVKEMIVTEVKTVTRLRLSAYPPDRAEAGCDRRLRDGAEAS